MVDPVWALAVAGVIALTCILAFWPGRGLFAAAARRLRLNERVLAEDALKHLHDCEYRDHPATMYSLAGALAVKRRRAGEILSRLERMELAAGSGGVYTLTDEGRSYARRVIRSHRLWERYFSDETGLPPSMWHQVAERREHQTTAREADAMAARMGHPRYDPHGDPIPTASGELAPRQGVPLTDFEGADVAEVVHVEDEPEAVFDELTALGLHPGQPLRILDVTASAIRVDASGRLHELPQVLAANLWVVPQLEPTEVAGGDRLSDLGRGESAEVLGLAPSCRAIERRRLLDLGFVPGTTVARELTGPGGDPIAFRVRGALIALRHEQADLIHVARRAA